MPETPYEKGRRLEYEAKERLESWFGMYVLRSAGSHSPIDLLAGNGMQVFAVQVKDGYLPSESELNMLRVWAEKFQATPVVMVKQKGGRWKIISVDGDEIFDVHPSELPF